MRYQGSVGKYNPDNRTTITRILMEIMGRNMNVGEYITTSRWSAYCSGKEI